MSTQPTIQQQRDAWSEWAVTTRERRLTEISTDQREVVLAWLDQTDRANLNILEVGCGPGWLCPDLKRFGDVTATDLVDDVLDRARARVSGVCFISGDFMELDFEPGSYDVVVTLEVLAHVADQRAFISKIATTLKPGGTLILATQNRPVLEQHNNVPAPSPGQIRTWVDANELRQLLAPDFDVRELKIITPITNKGPWRLFNNRKINWLLKKLFGNGPKRLKENLGLGWTLMTLAQKKAA